MDVQGAVELFKAVMSLGPLGILFLAFWLMANGMTWGKAHREQQTTLEDHMQQDFNELKEAFWGFKLEITKEIGELKTHVAVLNSGRGTKK